MPWAGIAVTAVTALALHLSRAVLGWSGVGKRRSLVVNSLGAQCRRLLTLLGRDAALLSLRGGLFCELGKAGRRCHGCHLGGGRGRHRLDGDVEQEADGLLLTEVVDTGVKVVRARDLIDKLRYIKSDTELLFIRESCVWGNLAHRLMHEKLELVATEMEISQEASTEASKMMVAALGPDYQPLTAVWGSPVMVGFHAGATPPCRTASRTRPACAWATSWSQAPAPMSAATTLSSSAP